MHLPLKRIFDEKRRLVIPVLAGLALNVVLFAGVVYPLGARMRSDRGARSSGRAAAAGGRARRRRRARHHAGARSDGHGAEGVLQGRASVEPRAGAPSHVPAADAACRTAQPRAVAPQHRSQAGQGIVARAAADLDDAAGQLRRHPPVHPSGRVGQRFHRHRQHLAAAGRRSGGAADAGAHLVDVLPRGSPMDRKRQRELALAGGGYSARRHRRVDPAARRAAVAGRDAPAATTAATSRAVADRRARSPRSISMRSKQNVPNPKRAPEIRSGSSRSRRRRRRQR